MIIEIISQILEESNFKVEPLEEDTLLFGSCQTTGIENHCLIVFLKEIPTAFVSKYIPEYYNALRSHLGERVTQSMIRNLSLIVCLRVKNMVSYDAQFLQIEEDPFDFKKYVLTFKQSETDELYKQWQLSGNDLIPFLNQIMHEKDSFNSYKQHMSSSMYGLVARLFIKIPFLSLKVKERNFEDLQVVIRGQLDDNLNSLLDRILKTSPNDILKELLGEESND